MKRNYILCLLLICNWLYSQNQMKDSHLNFIPKSPDVNSLGKYIEKPISLSNGSVNVSVPIYTLPINSNISIPINLQYNTQGIKVSEVSSSVGHGWNLSPIGMVSRNIRGKRDNYNDSSFYLQSIANAKTNLMDSSTSPNTNAWLEQNVDNVDLEPDEFNVSLFNMSFKFFYDFSTNKFYSTPLNNIKIIPTLNAYGNIVDFKIIDGAGNTYFFGKSDDNDNRFEVIDEVSNTLVSNDSAFSSGSDPQFNTWLLVKMTTNDNKVVRFYYEDNYTTSGVQDVYLNAQYKYYASTPNFVNGYYDVISWQSGNPVVVGTKYPISSEIAKTKEGKVYNVYSNPSILDKIIKKIIFENTEIEFVKSTIARKDFNAYSLEKIKIKNNNNLIKSFQLNQSYFNEEFLNSLADNSRTKNYIFTDYFDKSCARLKLNAVSEYDKNNQLISKHTFEYFPGQLPSKLSFAQDFFGYFNGQLGNAELIPNINFRYGYGLKSAGTAQRQVDLDYSKIGMLKKITYPTGGSTEFEYENHTYQGINDINEIVIGDLFSLQTFYIDFASEQSADPNTGSPLPPEASYEMPITFEEGVTVTVNTIVNKVINYTGHPTDSYNIIIYRKVNGNWEIFTLMSYTIQKTLWFPKGEYLLTASRLIPIDDPAVLEAGFSSTLSYLKSMPNIPNNPANPTTIQTAGGLRIKSITQKENNTEVLKTDYSYNEIVDGVTYSTGILYGYPLLVSQDFYEGINKFYGIVDYPFRNGSGSNIVYGKVTETMISNQNNKKIKKEYFFTHNASSESDEATIEFRNKTPYFGWKLNNLKEVLYYNQNNDDTYTLVKKDTIIYDQNNVKLNYTNGVRIEPRDRVLHSTLGGSDPSNFIYKTLYKYEYYPLFSDFSFEAKKQSTDYISGKTVTTTIDNTYTNPHFQISKQKTTFPDATINETIYNYAYEKGNQLLIDKNMVGIPLESNTTQTIGGITKTLGKTETVYPVSVPAIQTGNLILPTSVLSYGLQNPTTATTEMTYDKYDSKGNLQQYTTKAGIPTTIIWGYNNTQPIAKIEGARLSDISQSLINTIVSSSDTDAAAAPGNDETAFLSTLNNFTNDPSLSAYQITTFTYDPLVGVRSITPPSGIREVYIYDSANRLKEVREQNQTGKLLKEFQYNYKH